MIRFLSVGLVSASLMLASCATKKADCSSCCDSADKKAAACCEEDKAKCCDSTKKGA